MAKAPASRGFTIAEKRAMLFEQVALYAVFLVALIAAAISFIALRAVGSDAGLGRASFLLPLAIDGFGIACSVGIVRSVAVGEKFRERASEWMGLFGALALSILGNVFHALEVGAATLPDPVKIAYATAIPMIVAYGIHVYGRAMQKGISAHVMADNPDELVRDIWHLGDETVAATRAPVRTTPRAQGGAAKVPTPASVRAEPAREQAPAARTESAAPRAQADPQGEQALAREVFDRLLAADPTTKPDAARVREEAGIDRHAATVRRWVQTWWNEAQDELGQGSDDPIVAQVAADQARTNDAEGAHSAA